jgi:Mycotoxin biosynthesis protein UstYa
MESTWQTLRTVTEYSSPDMATADKAWDRYQINGFVALPKAWTEDRQWPAARNMPGDAEKGIYVVDGFHQLHCLVR